MDWTIGARAFAFAVRLLDTPLITEQQRLRILRWLGCDVTTGGIGPGLRLQRRNIHLGDDVWLNHDVWFDQWAGVYIGAHTEVGPGTRFLTATHPIGPMERRAGTFTTAHVHVGRGCFIGAAVTILPGVTIGDGCVIAAGAVVTRDCAPNGLYGGVPAKRLRELD